MARPLVLLPLIDELSEVTGTAYFRTRKLEGSMGIQNDDSSGNLSYHIS